MGLALRYFLVDDDDRVFRISAARYYRLREGDRKEALPEYQDSMLRYAEVVVELENRKPVSIVRVVYGYLKIDSKGKVDQNFIKNEIRTVSETLPTTPFSGELKNVISASDKFAHRRFKHEFSWTPSSRIEQEIFNKSFE